MNEIGTVRLAFSMRNKKWFEKLRSSSGVSASRRKSLFGHGDFQCNEGINLTLNASL